MKNSIIKDMEFRMNLFTNLITDFVFNMLKIFLIEIIYLNVDYVAGFNKYEILFIFGTSFVVLSLYMMFVFFNHIELPSKIQQGELDLVIIKPIGFIFEISFRKFNIAGIGSLLTGIYVIVYSALKLSLKFSLFGILLYIFLILIGFTVYYSISLVLFGISFLTIKAGGFVNVLVNMGELMKYPQQIFPNVLAILLSFVFPVFMVAAIPSEIILGKVSMLYVLGAFLVGMLALFLSVCFIEWAKRRYSGAGC